jgi:3,4-dihydroxy 2-butanone 4-phosphate synthase/GTP cyclohydrolase II
VTTGISAHDRAVTANLLANPTAVAADLNRPGHVLTLRARDGGILMRAGHTEAAVEFAVLSGHQPAGLVAALVEDSGATRSARSCRTFADEHALPLISIKALLSHLEQSERTITRVVDGRHPTEHGVFTAIGYRQLLAGGSEQAHVALAIGLSDDGRFSGGADVLVRLHSECVTGEALGSVRCDCGAQLDTAIERTAASGRGVVVYQRGHEGRSIGLLAKLQAYALQDAGSDTVDANLELGLPVDARDFGAAASILTDLGVVKARLMTNNPDKVAALREHGISISAIEPLVVGEHPENVSYLSTKRDRMGHALPPIGRLSADRG